MQRAVFIKIQEMRKVFIWSVLILTLAGCKNSSTEEFLELNFIKAFPEKVIITSFSQDYIDHKDTVIINDEADQKIKLDINKPQYLYIQARGEVLQVYIHPNEDLAVSNIHAKYRFKGASRQENEFLQEVSKNPGLKEKQWNYDNSFEGFKNEVDDYFKSKHRLLDKYIAERDNRHFYNLQIIEDRALKNSAYLSFINSSGYDKSQKDSLFLKYFDKSLLDFKKMEPYLESSHLKSFYSKMGVKYYLMEKYGQRLENVRDEQEYYILRGNIISEYFPQPIKSMLIYNDLKYYPLEFENVADSLDLTPPIDIFNRYKSSLNDEAFSTLVQRYDLTEKKKESYNEKTAVPDFIFKDQSLDEYKFSVKDFDKMILFDVWASWCKPCIENFPRIKDLENKYENKLIVISISMDEDVQDFKKSIERLGVPGNIKLYAENGFQGSLSEFFQIKAIPRYILIDPNGKILNGNINVSDLKNFLKQSSS